MLAFHYAPSRHHGTDHAVPDDGRLLPDQSRAEPAEAGDQPDSTCARRAEQLESWLAKNGYRQNFFVRYGQWLGVVQKQPNIDPATGKAVPRFCFCNEPAEPHLLAAYCRAISAARPSSRRTVAAKLFPGARRHRHADVLGDGDDGADLAADRHPRRHARGHRERTGRCRSPRSPRRRRPNMCRASSSPSSSPRGSAG